MEVVNYILKLYIFMLFECNFICRIPIPYMFLEKRLLLVICAFIVIYSLFVIEETHTFKFLYCSQ